MWTFLSHFKICSFSTYFRTGVCAFSVLLCSAFWDPSENALSHLSWIPCFGKVVSLFGVDLFLYQERPVSSLDVREYHMERTLAKNSTWIVCSVPRLWYFTKLKYALFIAIFTMFFISCYYPFKIIKKKKKRRRNLKRTAFLKLAFHKYDIPGTLLNIYFYKEHNRMHEWCTTIKGKNFSNTGTNRILVFGNSVKQACTFLGPQT